MKAIRVLASMVVACLFFSAGVRAQETDVDRPPVAAGIQTAEVSVPRLIRYSGTLADESGKPLTGIVAVEFAIYQDQGDASPIWQETQSLPLDAQGHYAVLLGATQPDGLPVELFRAGMARWLGVGAPDAAPQPRALLVAVPYALKAADADTLGGKPASAFMLSEPPSEGSSPPASGAILGSTSSPTAKAAARVDQTTSTSGGGGGSGGTTNFIPIWTSGTTLGNSVLFQSGGNVGVGTITVPGARLDAVSAGIALRGTSVSPTGTGVVGQNSATSGYTNGVYGHSASSSGSGVSGNATATTGQVSGVSGYTASTGTYAAGVSGYEGAATGQVSGVSGGTGSTTDGASAVSGWEGAATGQVNGVFGGTVSTTNGASGVNGYEGAATGQVYGVAGETSSTTNGAAGVIGSASGATGLVNGVYGSTASPNGDGVRGDATASSGGAVGVLGTNSGTGGNAIAVWGAYTGTSGGGVGVKGSIEASTGIGTAGQFISVSGQGLLLSGLSGSSLTQVFSVDASGNLDISGNLTVAGSKSARVKLQDGREVAVYALESPENWFEDFGTAELKGGTVEVPLEPGFLQTVDTAVDYHVFLTPKGDCHGLFVARTTPAGFEVRELGGGNASIAFDYRIVARRRGFETVRLQEVHVPQGPKDIPARFASMPSPGHVALPSSPPVLPPPPPKITIPPTPHPAEQLR